MNLANIKKALLEDRTEVVLETPNIPKELNTQKNLIRIRVTPEYNQLNQLKFYRVVVDAEQLLDGIPLEMTHNIITLTDYNTEEEFINKLIGTVASLSGELRKMITKLEQQRKQLDFFKEQTTYE